MTDLYQTLGVTPTASADEITKAYRKLAMQHHPDRETGNKELFQQVQEAYAVLSDPERRAQYDATGSANAPLSPEQLAERERVVKALHLVRSTLITVLLDPNVDPTKTDVLAEACKRLTGARDAMVKETLAQIQEFEQRKVRAEAAASRIAGDDEGTLTDLIASISAELDGPLASMHANMDNEIDQVGAALDVLAKATYNYDKIDFAAMEREALQRHYRTVWDEINLASGIPPGFLP